MISRQVINDIGYFLPVRASGDMEYADRVKAFYGNEKSTLLLEYTYLSSKRANNLTSLIDVNGPKRQHFLAYAHKPKGECEHSICVKPF
ncbi:MAG: hypothetical protein AB8G86_12005 [Saprospiraceae bacterium]